MATVSNNYSDAALYNDWVSEASESKEENEFFYESDQETPQIDTSSTSDVEEFVEFDGTAPDTEFFIQDDFLNEMNWEEENEDLSYFCEIAAVNNFDFSNVHVPLSQNESKSKSPNIATWIENCPSPNYQQEVPSLLSSENNPDTSQVMNDSIHLAEDSTSLFDVSGNSLLSHTQTFNEPFSTNALDFMQTLSNDFYGDAYDEEDHSKMHNDSSSSLHSLEKEDIVENSLVSDDSLVQDEYNNSPSKQQTVIKKSKQLKNIKEQETSTTAQKRKRNIFDESHNQKRRRLNNNNSQNTNSNLPLQNLVRKKYLIALNDPRFMPQFNDPTLKSNYFAHEQVLRIIDTDYDVDII